MRKMQNVLLALFMTSASVVIGSPPPPMAGAAIPPAVRPENPPTPIPNLPVVPDPGGPLTLARLEQAQLSSSVYHILRRLILQQSAETAVPQMAGVATATADADLSAVTEKSYLATPLLSYPPGTGVNVTADAYQDAEPSVVAFAKNGITYTVTAAMKYTPSTLIGRIRAYRSATTPPSSFTCGPNCELRNPPGTPYQNTADPYVAANVLTGGVWPGRVYCTGMLFTAAADNGQFYLNSSIGLWHSDDGGDSWSEPSGVAWQFGGGVLTDKPTMAVSYYSGTAGDIYVAWVDRNLNNPNGSGLRIARSTDGGATFEGAVVISYDNVQAPTIAVDSNTGRVYVIWLNLHYGDLRMASSSGLHGQPLAFGAHSSITTNINTLTLNGGVRALTVPAARFNWIANRLILAWHGRGASGTDVFYSYFPCSGAGCTGYSWHTPIQLSTTPTNDQFMPGLDYNRYGDVLVSFYDRHDDPSNLRYHEYVAELHADGTGLTNVRVSDFQSDPTIANGNTVDRGFIGDYQDAWIWAYPDGDRLVSSWTAVPAGGSAIGDIYVTRTIP